MKLPENHPNTHHYDPYWFSDSPAGIRKARRQTPRGHTCFKDLNLQVLFDGDGFIHWGTARKNGYRFLQVRPFKRRPLTERELDLPFEHWPAAKFKKLRRTRRAGISYESHVRPMLFKKGIKVCRRYDVIPCVELKSWQYSSYHRIRNLTATVAALSWTVFYMALYKMGHSLEKGASVIWNGGQYALLAHGEKRPRGLEQGVNYTEIWGHFT